MFFVLCHIGLLGGGGPLLLVLRHVGLLGGRGSLLFVLCVIGGTGQIRPLPLFCAVPLVAGTGISLISAGTLDDRQITGGIVCVRPGKNKLFAVVNAALYFQADQEGSGKLRRAVRQDGITAVRGGGPGIDGFQQGEAGQLCPISASLRECICRDRRGTCGLQIKGHFQPAAVFPQRSGRIPVLGRDIQNQSDLIPVNLQRFVQYIGAHGGTDMGARRNPDFLRGICNGHAFPRCQRGERQFFPCDRTVCDSDGILCKLRSRGKDLNFHRKGIRQKGHDILRRGSGVYCDLVSSIISERSVPPDSYRRVKTGVKGGIFRDCFRLSAVNHRCL